MSDDRSLDAVGVVVALLLVMMVGVLVLTFAGAVGGDRQAADAPNAQWTLERVDDTHVRIAHAGGEPVPTDRLVVTVDGYQRRATWSGTVSRGDAGTVTAALNTQVRLYWTTDRGERVRLGSWAA